MTPAICRAARALLDISQQELADAAQVGLSTVRSYETGKSVPVVNNLAAIERALLVAGVTFISAGDVSTVHGVGLSRKGKS